MVQQGINQRLNDQQMDLQQINQNVNNKINDVQREMDQKADLDGRQDQTADMMRSEVENVKREMEDVLQTKINENHELIEESAKRMDALIKEAN